MMDAALTAALLPSAARAGRRRRRRSRACHTDTRTLQPGDLFVALRGERFDGHDFVAAGASRAAPSAALVDRRRALARSPACRVAGAPTRWPALGAARRRLARALRAAADRGHRQQRQDHGQGDDRRHPARARSATARVLATAGQPQQRHRPAADAAAPARRRTAPRVVELGMNHPGEIALAGRASRSPTVALVNNAQREHQEFMATRRGGGARARRA